MCISTDAGTWRELAGAQRQEIVSALESRGLRLTQQRQAVCEAVFGCPGHICAEHILSIVGERHPDLRMNKTTVYRALDLLQGLGLVIEHKCGDGRAQYEAASRGRHSHLMCRQCGQMLDMDEEIAANLRQGLRSRQGFQTDLESYPILGLCSACAARPESPPLSS